MSEEAIKLFYSYSRKDLDMRNRLENHLSALRRANRISTWHDLELEAGTEWEPAILNKLDTADIILLLVSSDFIASEYCYGTELKRAIARHNEGTARVIPIILRPCDWNYPDVPFSKLAALPTNVEAITSWTDSEKAFTNVAQHIRKTVDQLRAKKQAERQAQEQQEKQLLAQREAGEQAERERIQREQQEADKLEQQRQAEYVNQQKAEVAELQRQQKLERQQREAEQRRQTNRPLTRQQFLKWAIPVGVGVVGLSIANQFSGHQSPQLSPSSKPNPNPIATASRVAEQSVTVGKAEPHYLGIKMAELTPAIRNEINQSNVGFKINQDRGVLIVGVQPNSPAARGGVLPGDIIASVDGTAIQTAQQVQQQVNATKIGSPLQIVVNRNGQKQTLTVTSEPLPAKEPGQGK